MKFASGCAPWDAPVVRGNHDRACSGLSSLSEFNLVAAMSARWTQITLQPDHLDWLRSLPQGPLRLEEFPGLEFVHGSPRDEDEYVLNNATAGVDFHLPGHADNIFFGHTHLQGGFRLPQRKDPAISPQYPNGEGVESLPDHADRRRALSDQSGIGGAAARQRLARRLCAIRNQRRHGQPT